VIEVARDRRQQQAEIEFAGGKRGRLLRGKHFAQRQRHAGMRSLEGLQQSRQHAEVGQRHEAQSQSAAGAGSHAPDLEHGAFELCDQALRLLEEARTLGRQRHLAERASEQRGAQARLQILDRAREGRLRHVQRRGGAAEVQVLGHGDEMAQLAEFRGIHT
jgi:hypothetical protein